VKVNAHKVRQRAHGLDLVCAREAIVWIEWNTLVVLAEGKLVYGFLISPGRSKTVKALGHEVAHL
jgi:hypothetical protein